MKQILKKLTSFFQVDKNIPAGLAENFVHYYWDITWYGLLNGTTLSFLNYFAVRVGANSTQVGVIAAMPAIVSLIFALPAGVILKRFSFNRATFVTAVLTRMFYLVFILLPFVKTSETVITAVILVTLVMSIPAVFSTVGFNTSFALNIPDEYRAHVAGVRNAGFAIVTIFVSLVSGFILDTVKFPYGYAIVFGIGFIGSAFSAYHLYKLKTLEEFSHPWLKTSAREEHARRWIIARIAEIGRLFRQQIRMDLIKGRSGTSILLLTLIMFALYISGPVFPVYLVNKFHFSDQVLSIGMASFNFAVFLGSMRLESIERRLGRKKSIGLGFILMSFFPAALIFMQGPLLYYTANLISGFGSAFVNGELFNYLYERIPAGDHSSGVAWYTLGANTAVLIGSFAGPLIANSVGFSISMIIFTIIRFAVSLAILRWG